MLCNIERDEILIIAPLQREGFRFSCVTAASFSQHYLLCSAGVRGTHIAVISPRCVWISDAKSSNEHTAITTPRTEQSLQWPGPSGAQLQWQPRSFRASCPTGKGVPGMVGLSPAIERVGKEGSPSKQGLGREVGCISPAHTCHHVSYAH